MLVGTCSWGPCLETLGNLFLGIFGKLKCFWEPVPGNLALQMSWEPLGIFGNLFLGTFDLAWEPGLGTCSWESLGTFGNLFLGNLAWELRLGTFLGNLAFGNLEPCLGTLLGNLAWKPLGTLLGNLAWEPFLEPFLGTWKLWQSGFWLLRRDLYYG
mgnify:CR=1 FL=1